MRIESALRLIYPPLCLACGDQVGDDAGLCGSCWRDTGFINGLVCDLCGVPLPGDDETELAHCDDCMTLARPWSRGRAALVYKDVARKLVMALKHGDRGDLARPAASWLLRAGAPILQPDTLLVPVPLHWRRLLMRRYNQSALLGGEVAKQSGLTQCPDLLRRKLSTPSLDGLGRDARFQALSGAIEVHPRRKHLLQNRRIVLIDDVMTSGASFAACAEACLAAGAQEICILALARVAKDT